jgi:prepilin-type N-terminal cleavage/methylation domain-containing protein
LTGGAIRSDSHYGRKTGSPLEKGEIMLYDVADKGMKTGNKEPSLMHRRTKKEGGFSLIEVLVTIFILGAVCITLISVFIYGFNLLAKTKQTAVVTQVAQFEVERYRNMDFATIGVPPISAPLGTTTSTFQELFNDDETSPYYFMFKKDGSEYIPFLRNGQETIVIEDGSTINMDNNIKKMTVTVVWDYRNRTIAAGDPMRKDVVTYFSKDGINRR